MAGEHGGYHTVQGVECRGDHTATEKLFVFNPDLVQGPG